MSVAAPRFTIVIPTYNRAHLIGQTIESVLRQEFTDFEILVVDDGSTDNTGDVVGAFQDSRIKYFRKDNAERGAARNYGASVARGEYVNFFDSDDLMYPNHVQIANMLIQKSNQPEFIHLAFDYKSPDGDVIKRINNFTDEINRQLLFDNKLSCNGVFIRKDIIARFPFEENRVLASSEDWHLWIRLAARFKLIFSNEITSSVVNHDQRSLFTINAKKIIDRDLLLISKLKSDTPVIRIYGGSFNRFIADRYTFFMLCQCEQKHYRQVWEWGLKAFWIYPLILINKRFLASLRNSLLR